MACGGCKEIKRVSDMINKSDNTDLKGGKYLLGVLSDVLVLIIGLIIGFTVIVPYVLYSMISGKSIKIKSLKRKVNEQ